MSIRIKKISTTGLLRLSSNKNIRKPVIILPRGKVLASQSIAHGHDRTVFADVPEAAGLDPATMEISSDNSSPRFYNEKKRNVKAIHPITKKAKNTGYRRTTNNETMPYGLYPEADKENANRLLQALKAKHAKN